MFEEEKKNKKRDCDILSKKMYVKILRRGKRKKNM